MPWLVGTALIHSLAVTEKRGGFKSWTVLLAICAFSLEPAGNIPGALRRADFGARVRDRSQARHFHPGFSGDRDRRLAAAVMPGARSKSGLGGKFEVVSRESLLLSNNVLLVVAAGSVLLGTLYPLIIDALGLGKLSVGRRTSTACSCR